VPPVLSTAGVTPPPAPTPTGAPHAESTRRIRAVRPRRLCIRRPHRAPRARSRPRRRDDGDRERPRRARRRGGAGAACPDPERRRRVRRGRHGGAVAGGIRPPHRRGVDTRRACRRRTPIGRRDDEVEPRACPSRDRGVRPRRDADGVRAGSRTRPGVLGGRHRPVPRQHLPGPARPRSGGQGIIPTEIKSVAHWAPAGARRPRASSARSRARVRPDRQESPRLSRRSSTRRTRVVRRTS
jgi:hypothetical protein